MTACVTLEIDESMEPDLRGIGGQEVLRELPDETT